MVGDLEEAKRSYSRQTRYWDYAIVTSMSKLSPEAEDRLLLVMIEDLSEGELRIFKAGLLKLFPGKVVTF